MSTVNQPPETSIIPIDDIDESVDKAIHEKSRPDD
jgi:hypothetical protein